ncbi:hypothetical protein [Haloarcula salina]|uniref:Uncharacterized protein n=1 Tax=Haloarcula salina TaxID=1429914 RepID=A0AA41KJX3_9EURY|nr:hypothetical protein [Haloarcula salina]MBV0903218.1 hypothetical protein [Haloarcula salina]
MVGPSLTEDDRRRFLRKIQAAFALLVGASMGLVTLYGRAPLLVVAGAALLGTAVGGVLAWYTLPSSIADSPYESVDRGPKPGAQMRRRREADDSQRAGDGDGRVSRNRD